MRSHIGSDGLTLIASVLFLAVGFLWAFGCAPSGSSGPQCKLTVDIYGNGQVDVFVDDAKVQENWFPCGTEVRLEAIPDSGWHFVEWFFLDDGKSGGSSINCTLNEDVLVMATFEKT